MYLLASALGYGLGLFDVVGLMRLRRPASLGGQILGAAGAVVGELTGEQGDAARTGVVAKPVAGHADLAAAGLEQHCLIEVGPLLDGLDAGGLNP